MNAAKILAVLGLASVSFLAFAPEADAGSVFTCKAGHGDVAQTVYVTNASRTTFKKGAKINWVSTSNATIKGTITLDKDLPPGAVVTDLAPPGNGFECNANLVLSFKILPK